MCADVEGGEGVVVGRRGGEGVVLGAVDGEEVVEHRPWGACLVRVRTKSREEGVLDGFK